MKISFFQFYPFTIWTPGGGETELRQTKLAVEKLGVETDFFDIWRPNNDFDILHVFGSTYHLADFVVAAKKLNMKVIVSSIAYSNKPAFVWCIFKLIDRVIPFDTVYTLRKKIYENADLIIPTSQAEAEQLIKYFGINPDRIRVIFNGADSLFVNARQDKFIEKYGLRDFILMVGRINNRKGQLRLLEAASELDTEVVFVGDMDPSEPGYYERFVQECANNSKIHYLGALRDRVMLASAYAAAKVHALPSVAEFPGLVSLEAAVAGTNVVAGYSLPTFEQLGDNIFYCDPLSIKSIRKALMSALRAPRNDEWRKRLAREFTWERVAEDIIEVYKEVISNEHVVNKSNFK